MYRSHFELWKAKELTTTIIIHLERDSEEVRNGNEWVGWGRPEKIEWERSVDEEPEESGRLIEDVLLEQGGEFLKRKDKME